MRSVLDLCSGMSLVCYRTVSRLLRKRVRLLAVVLVLSLLIAALPGSSGRVRATNTTNAVSAESLPLQFYRSLRTTLAAVGIWMAEGLRSEKPAESTYQPVTAYLSPAPPFIDAPTNLNVTATTDTTISLSWTAPGGSVDHYQIERSQSISGPFLFRANTTNTTFQDGSVTTDQAYLYRIRAVTSGGLPSTPSNMALGTATSFEFNGVGGLQGQPVRKQHFYDVRTAINAVRLVAGLAQASWAPRADLTGQPIQANDVQEMRNKLTEALTVLDVPILTYQDATLQTGANGTPVKAIHIDQLQVRATRGSSESSGPVDPDSSTARLDPLNQTGGGGENPLSRNFNWSLPLVGLPGRAGMDLGLVLSYNSLVWTKIGNTVSFNDDNGFPGPGFRVGFPVIQPSYLNAETGKIAYLLIGSDGSRTELRQVSTSGDGANLYEAADSSHLLLDTTTTPFILRMSDGTQLSYELKGGEYQCTKIKDRNGNYITVNYTTGGKVDEVIDTLGRSIDFVYDANGWLTQIKQLWNSGAATQYWAKFEYTNVTIDTNFSSLAVIGPADSDQIKMLSKVTLPDDSHYDFSYTSWGQVWKITKFGANNQPINYRSYDLPQTGATAHQDCPRFTARKDWAKYWNGDTDGTTATNEEVSTAFIVPVSDTWTMPDPGQTQLSGVRAQVTTSDGTINKIYFVGTAGMQSGWSRGLPVLVDTISGGVTQRRSMTTWTQDNTSVPYLLNPRVLETNVYDTGSNRARTRIDYQQLTFTNETSCHLPRDVFEYAADADTILRTTRTNYITGTTYTDRRILGLASEKLIYQGNVTGTLVSKVQFAYDEVAVQSLAAAAPQHDNPAFNTGRANLTSVKRYNADNLNESTTTSNKYNTTGAVISIKDNSTHEMLVSYTDSFSDGITSRHTSAYPTTVTDADGHASTAKYNFDFGARTSRRTPSPNPNSAEPEQTYTFDSIGRLQQVTNLVNNAYTRFTYATDNLRVDTYMTIQAGSGEAHTFQITDGAGRVIATATDHPGSDGGFSGQRIIYDVMGRVFKTSNPTETSASGTPFQWNTDGDDESAGWLYTEQTYDWKGRPVRTTHPDTTYREAAYSGCGCAGGEVVTLTDEGTKVGADTKKRQQKIYTDVLGRVIKNETLNWDGAGPNGTGGTAYSTTTKTYNTLDQVTLIRQFEGTTSSTTFQDITMSYDGYGRLKTRHLPHQKVDPNNSASTDHTTWNYNGDDTVQSIVDARGVITNFTYNARHLLTAIAYDKSNVPTGANVAPTTSVAFTYDAVGNRTSMSDGTGAVTYHYDQLSQMDWEERTFSGLPNAGTFRLSYEYSLGGVLKKVTDERAETSFTQTLDKIGQVTAVNAVGYQGAQTQFASEIEYRAGGQLKSRVQSNTTVSFGYNNRGLVNTYSLTGLVNATYEYHQDGMIKLAQNGNPIKDRAYSYDTVARLQTSFSGVEARNYVNDTTGGTPDGPYRHDYTYDPWNNLTEDESRFWTRDASTVATYGLDNRNPSWSYDAEGNLLSRNEPGGFDPSEPAKYKFDAAGREINSTQKRSYFFVEEGTGVLLTHDLQNTSNHDGDGQVIDYSVLRHLHVNTNFSTTFGGKAFLLRSTVLGGRTISEYNDTGTWVTSHVFAGDERIGQVTTGPPALWHNFDPVTGDLVSTIANGSSWSTTTLDSSGADVGNEDPFAADGSGDPDGIMPEGPGGKSVAGILGIESGRSRCVLDGLEVECSFIRGESSVQCPDNDCGPRWNPNVNNGRTRGAWEWFHSFNNGYQGWMTSYGLRNYAGGSQFYNSAYDDHNEIKSILQRTVKSLAGGIARGSGMLLDFGSAANASDWIFPISSDPCFLNKFRLNYDKPRKPDSDGKTSARMHIAHRHINLTAHPDKSKYRAASAISEGNVFRLVRVVNQLTFQNATGFKDRGRIVYVYAVPEVDVNQTLVPLPYTKVQLAVGEDRSRADKFTNVNTLVIEPDCRTVVTSHPGLPAGMSQNDPRIHGRAVFSPTAIGPLLDYIIR